MMKAELFEGLARNIIPEGTRVFIWCSGVCGGSTRICTRLRGGTTIDFLNMDEDYRFEWTWEMIGHDFPCMVELRLEDGTALLAFGDMRVVNREGMSFTFDWPHIDIGRFS